MAAKFMLEIVTPDRIFFDGEVEMVVVRTTQGDMAVMADHMWTISPLNIGIIKIKHDGNLMTAACASGFIQVKEDKTIIITDSAEWPEEIDVERAQKAKIRAEERLAGTIESVDITRAKASMIRALTRIRVKESLK